MRFIRAAATVLVGQVIAAALGGVGLVLAARLLTTRDFADLQVFISTASVLALILGMGLVNVVARTITLEAGMDNNAPGRFECYAAAILVIGLISAIFLLPSMSHTFSAWMQNSRWWPDLPITFAICAAAFMALQGIGDSALRGLQEFSLQQILAVLSRLAVIAAVLAAPYLDSRVAYAGWLFFVQCVFLIYLLLRLRGYRTASSWSITVSIKRMTGLGFPYLLAAFPSLFRTELLVLWLAFVSSAVDGASFRIALRVSAFLAIGLDVIQTPYLPKAVILVSDRARHAKFGAFYEAVTHLQLRVIIPPLIVFFYFHELLFVLIFGERYEGASVPAVILALTVALHAIFGPLNNTLIAAGLARQKLAVELISIGLPVIGMALMWDSPDALTAAVISVCGNLAWFLAAITLLNRQGIPVIAVKPFLIRIRLTLILCVGTIILCFSSAVLFVNIVWSLCMLAVVYVVWGLHTRRTVRLDILG